MSALSLGYYNYQSANVVPARGTTDVDRFSIDLGYWSAGRLALGAAYRGTHLNETGIDLQTNGYLHTFLLPVHARFGSSAAGWRVSVAPALSGSSNVVKDPGEWETEAWQLLAAIVGNRKVNHQVTVRYGVCADHVFGDYRVYPLVRFDWQFSKRWSAGIGFPRSLLAYRISEHFEARIAIAPAGNSWLVKDRTLEDQSVLSYEAWSVDWALRWMPSAEWRLALALGYEFESDYEATLASGQRLALGAEPTMRLALRAAWRW